MVTYCKLAEKNPLCYTSSLYYLRDDGGKAKALVNQEYSTEQHEEHSNETENQWFNLFCTENVFSRFVYPLLIFISLRESRGINLSSSIKFVVYK